MDTSHMRRIVDEHIAWLRWALGLSDWKIVVKYAPIESPRGSTVPACCRLDPPYRSACITLDPASTDDEEEVLRNLVHELLHVVLSPTDLFKDAVRQAVSVEDMQILYPVWHDSVERCIANLERFFKVAGLDAKELVARASAKFDEWGAPHPSLSETPVPVRSDDVDEDEGIPS